MGIAQQNYAVFVFLAFSVGLFRVAYANDSLAERPLGGLVLIKSDPISMDSEDLFVSRERIRVQYLFTNATDTDVDALVAFPLPAIPGYPSGAGLAADDFSARFPSDADQINTVKYEGDPKILGFHTLVEGKRVELQLEEKAFFRGQEVTARLERIRVPVNRFANNFDESINVLTQEDRQGLINDGLVVKDEIEGNDREWAGAWELRTTLVRRQVFPAKRTISVVHEYAPLVGASPGRPDALNNKYCVDAKWLRSADAKDREFGGIAPPRKDPAFVDEGLSESFYVAYVLTSGANWKGPIKDFHLVVDKGSPDSMVSFCASSVQKISPTRFEVRYTNFVPTDDLRVLFVDWRKRAN